MKKFVQWMRANAAVIIATGALVSVSAPGVRDLAGAVSAVTQAIAAQPISEE